MFTFNFIFIFLVYLKKKKDEEKKKKKRRIGGLGEEALIRKRWGGDYKKWKWESIEKLSRQEKGNQKKEKRKLKWEVFEESAWERGRDHFLDGNEGFSREDIKGSLRGESREVGKRYRFEKEWVAKEEKTRKLAKKTKDRRKHNK